MQKGDGMSEFDTTIPPTEIGQKVRFRAYGGNVRQWMLEATVGVVTRFTHTGNPVVRIEGGTHWPGQHDIHHTFDCARRVSADGRWIRPEEIA